jgi:hypothetical protein
MKTPTEELETPYLDREFEFVVPTYRSSGSLAHAIDESPFANFVGVAGTETSQPPQSGLEPQELETLELDEPMAETWTRKRPGMKKMISHTTAMRVKKKMPQHPPSG